MSNTRYRYRAARPDGTIVKGLTDGQDQGTVQRQLAAEGLSVIAMKPTRRWTPRARVSRTDLAVAFRNVAILVSDGVPIERAMGASEDLVGAELREALRRARRMLREGHSVSVALAEQEDVFPRTVVGIVAAGERGSRLAEACESVAERLAAEARLRSELWSALTYPLLILVVGVVSVLVMGVVVVPRFADVFAGFGAELPPATRLLLGGSAAVRRFGIPAAMLIAALVVGGLTWTKRQPVRRRLDALLLSIPFVGPLRLGFSSARTCLALGGMLSTGMPLLASLDAAGEAAGDLEVSRRLASAREAVSRGQPLSAALSEHRALSPFSLQLIGVGEASGRLGPMTTRAGEIAAERTQASLRATLSLVEPLLIIALGGLVAAVAGALLQAVYAVRP